MSIETPADLEGLRQVGRVVAQTLDALQASVRAGVTTAELDEVAAAVFAAQGARSAPALVYGFPGTVLISVNDEVVHGIPGPRRLCAGDLVKLDVTAEKNGYIADAARSVIVDDGVDASVGGHVGGTRGGGADGGTETARRLLACATSAFQAAMRVCWPGNKVREIGRVVEREVEAHGFRVIRDLAGHGVGRSIHEPPSVLNYWDPSQRDVLTEGLVLAVEPMVSAGSGRVVEARDGWTIRTADGSFAAHYEHTVVITRRGPVLLTAAAAAA